MPWLAIKCLQVILLNLNLSRFYREEEPDFPKVPLLEQIVRVPSQTHRRRQGCWFHNFPASIFLVIMFPKSLQVLHLHWLVACFISSVSYLYCLSCIYFSLWMVALGRIYVLQMFNLGCLRYHGYLHHISDFLYIESLTLFFFFNLLHDLWLHIPPHLPTERPSLAWDQTFFLTVMN